MRQVTLCLLLFLVAVTAFSQDANVHRNPLSEEQWVSAFSIIAYDPNTDEHGGVQTVDRAVGDGVGRREAPSPTLLIDISRSRARRHRSGF